MYEVAEGMKALHNEPPRVIHRNIKSSNIFLNKQYEAKIGDFGLCKLMRNEFDVPSIPSFSDIKLFAQPPEVLCAGTYSTKSDVYSFGVVMHELLIFKNVCGMDCLHSSTYYDSQRSVRNGQAPMVPLDRSKLLGEWHPCLEKYIDLMHECLTQNPTKRPEFDYISCQLKDKERQYMETLCYTN